MGISLQPAHTRLSPISYRKHIFLSTITIFVQKLLYLDKNMPRLIRIILNLVKESNSKSDYNNYYIKLLNYLVAGLILLYNLLFIR